MSNYSVSAVELISSGKPYKFISIRSKEVDGRYYEMLFHLSRNGKRIDVEVYFSDGNELIAEPISFDVDFNEFNGYDVGFTVGEMFREIMTDVLSEYEEYGDMIDEFDFDAPHVLDDVFKNIKDYPELQEYVKNEKNHQYKVNFWNTERCSNLMGRSRIDF